VRRANEQIISRRSFNSGPGPGGMGMDGNGESHKLYRSVYDLTSLSTVLAPVAVGRKREGRLSQRGLKSAESRSDIPSQHDSRN
jgi:hypothetical protein